MKRVLIPLVAFMGAAAWGVAPAQAQQSCPPGQTGNAPYCQTQPPPQPKPQPKPQPPRPAACDKFTSKLELARATFSRAARTISILAPITARASGSASVQLHAAGLRRTFSAPVDSANSRIRVTRRITRAQARLGTGILTFRYPGDADTRSQVVRLRAANNQANLEVTRPTITPNGVLQASGTITGRARGVVRVQIEYVNRLTGQTVTLENKARIANGRWRLNTQLSPTIRAQIAQRCGTVHSYTLFTGYFPLRIRGELESFEVLPAL